MLLRHACHRRLSRHRCRWWVSSSLITSFLTTASARDSVHWSPAPRRSKPGTYPGERNPGNLVLILEFSGLSVPPAEDHSANLYLHPRLLSRSLDRCRYRASVSRVDLISSRATVGCFNGSGRLPRAMAPSAPPNPRFHDVRTNLASSSARPPRTDAIEAHEAPSSI